MGGHMIALINGAFGSGKTTLAETLVQLDPRWLLFDPEEVGFMLRRVCGSVSPGYAGAQDFQDIECWASMVVKTAEALVKTYARDLVVPMTITDPAKLQTITDGLSNFALVHHFVLECPRSELEERLVSRNDGPGTWAWHQIERCFSDLPKLDGTRLNSANQMPDELARQVLEAVDLSG
jgi:predicted kinase